MSDLPASPGLTAGPGVLDEPASKALLARFGIPVPRGRRIGTPEALTEALSALEMPVAVKAISIETLHKSDAGGVALALHDAVAVREALEATSGVPGHSGWLIEEMASPGIELMLGGLRHPRFGPMLMVGLGGILVEVLEDVSLRICPVSRTDAHAMLDELRAARLIDGVRGRPGADREAIVEAMLKVGGEQGLLMTHAAEIQELDINPLVATPTGVCAVDAAVVLAPAIPEPARPPVHSLRALLEPDAIAIAGASTAGKAQANQYLRNLRAYGYQGDIYAIHPRASEVDGVPAFPGFSALPRPVDYAYIAVAAPACAPLLADAKGKLGFAQVMSGGFGEGDSDPAMEASLMQAAEEGGVRVLGPNCMGTHSPAGRVTYMSGVDERPGPVAIVAQSGGLSSDVLRRGARRGLRFRGLVTVGNSADVGPAELAGAFLDDPGTGVLGLYLEDPRRGRRLFEALRERAGRTPVALLVGGTSEQGRRAASSHTGALAGDARAWSALAAQTGAAPTRTLDEFLDVLLAMQQLRGCATRATRDVVLFGNGGGTSVLAADAFAREGLRVPELPAAARDALDALSLPVGTSVANPIDAPANVLARDDGRLVRVIVETVFEHASPDAFVIHVNVPVVLGYSHVDIIGHLMEATLDCTRRDAGGGRRRAHVVLVLRSDGEPEIEALKATLTQRALEAGLPVYGELADAARALRGLACFETAAALRSERTGDDGQR